MILPIYAFGQPVLSKKGKQIEAIDEEIKTLVANMWETMYNASGIGIAAPQIGKSLRLFVIDTKQMEGENSELTDGVKKVFINAVMLDEWDEPYEYEEGCLSIPHIRGNVSRNASIKIEYQDLEGNLHTEEYKGLNARVIQHEYDHIEGKLFTDYLKPIKKRRIKRKLEAIKKGEVSINYRMRYV